MALWDKGSKEGVNGYSKEEFLLDREEGVNYSRRRETDSTLTRGGPEDPWLGRLPSRPSPSLGPPQKRRTVPDQREGRRGRGWERAYRVLLPNSRRQTEGCVGRLCRVRRNNHSVRKFNGKINLNTGFYAASFPVKFQSKTKYRKTP